MGTFDPQAFLETNLTESNSTVQTPCPEGEYSAVCLEEPKIRTFQGTKDPSKTYVSLDIVWTIENPAVTEVTGRNPTKVRQNILLDLNDSGALDMGKGRNVQLGRLREAIGKNNPGQPFSFRQIQGASAKVKVTHRVDGESIYDEVRSVARSA